MLILKKNMMATTTTNEIFAQLDELIVALEKEPQVVTLEKPSDPNDKVITWITFFQSV